MPRVTISLQPGLEKSVSEIKKELGYKVNSKLLEHLLYLGIQKYFDQNKVLEKKLEVI